MKTLFALACLLFSASSFADSWHRYASTDGANRYYDPYRKVVMSGMAVIWDLHELPSDASDGGRVYRSVLYPTEYNCRKEQRRVLSMHRMAGRMGDGEMVQESTLVGHWVDVQPGTPEASLMQAACRE